MKNIDLSPFGRRIPALVPNCYKLRRPLPKLYSWDVNGILPLEQEQLRAVKTTNIWTHRTEPAFPRAQGSQNYTFFPAPSLPG